MRSPRAESFEFPLTWVQALNWTVLALLTLAGWYLYSEFVARGILVGGVIANVSFICLKNDLTKILGGPLRVARIRFFLKYYARLAVLAVVLYLLVRYQVVHVLGLLIGLSTVVLSVGVTTAGLVKRYFIVAKEAL